MLGISQLGNPFKCDLPEETAATLQWVQKDLFLQMLNILRHYNF